MKRTPFVNIFIFIAFLVNTFGPFPQAQADEFILPAPGQMVALSPAYSPAVLKGIKLDPKNPFRFHFYVDTSDEYRHPERSEGSQQEQLKQESAKLIKYFLASLTIPEKDLWVNLSPYEKDRIVPQEFGQTEMGRDLLAEDYLLKQITASIIYPESKLGKEFWVKVYAQAQLKYGTTNIPINTFNKVWIVPDKAVVYENNGTAFVLENHLKVMLEKDYLSTKMHSAVRESSTSSKLSEISQDSSLASSMLRAIVIPQLTKEVNEGKNFAQLRQVFYSLILATWYKKKIKDSILNKIYADQNKIIGLSPTRTPTWGHVAEAQQNSLRDRNVSPSRLPTSQALNLKATQRNQLNDVELIYQQYIKAFKKGVYNYIKEEPAGEYAKDSPSLEGGVRGGGTIPRKYFSGGVMAKYQIGEDLAMVGPEKYDFAMAVLKKSKMIDIAGDFNPIKKPADAAMNSTNLVIQTENQRFPARKAPLEKLMISFNDMNARGAALKALGVDSRLFDKRFMNPVKLTQFETIKRIINPKDEEEFIGIYLAASSDISGYLTLTNAKEGYFIDTTEIHPAKFQQYLTDAGWESLGQTKSESLTKYNSNKFNGGWIGTDKQGVNAIEEKILYELKMMDVKKETIRIKLEDGIVVVGFNWAYQGQQERPRSIKFITADILNENEILKKILKRLQGKVDIVFSKASLDLPYYYDKFLKKYTDTLKIGGFLVTDNYFMHNMSFPDVNIMAPVYVPVYGYSDPDRILKNDPQYDFRRLRSLETDFFQEAMIKRVASIATVRHVTEKPGFMLGIIAVR